jgi:GT2 family glycosyltransferase
MTPHLSIGITTRNRPEALRACLESLESLGDLPIEILVFDDGSAPPADVPLPAGVPPVRLLREDAAPGYIVGRNRLVRAAAAPNVLLLDDDTKVFSRESVEQALAVFAADPHVAAVAFAQAEADGSLWPSAMQPSPVRYPCIVPSFIGFAHLLRREVFLALGGYREDFIYYGEEKDFCLRLLDAGYRTVYLPAAGVGHLPATSGRSQTRYLRFVVRNDCLNALYNDPLPRVLWTLPVRYALYFRMRRAWRIHDPWGWLWVARELAIHSSRTVFHRRPVSRATIRLWRSLKKSPVPYPSTDAGCVRDA